MTPVAALGAKTPPNEVNQWSTKPTRIAKGKNRRATIVLTLLKVLLLGAPYNLHALRSFDGNNASPFIVL